jgi:hypothetical protein
MALEEDIEEAEEETESTHSNSVRDAVAAAFDEVEGQVEGQDSAAPTPVDDKPRDEHGRFAPKLEQTQSANAEPQAAQPIQTEVTPKPSIELPTSLKLETREALAKLPPEAQQAFVERLKEVEAGFNRKHAQVDRIVQGYQAVDQAVAPHIPALQQRGIAPHEAISSLLNADAYLERDPIGGMLWLMQSKGVTLDQLAEAGQNSAQYQVHPIVEQRLAQIEGMFQAQQRQQQEVRQRALLADVASFANENQNGATTHPHFEKVSNLMRPIVEYLRQDQPDASNYEILKQAYEQAVYAHPETRNLSIQAQLEREKQAEQVAKQAQAEKAKAAAISLKGTPGGQATSKPKSIKDAVTRAFEIHGM